MAKTITQGAGLDEDALRDAMATNRYGLNRREDAVPEPPPEEAPPEPSPATVSPKNRRDAAIGYEALFLKKIGDTKSDPVYITRATKVKLQEIVKALGGIDMNVLSYLENILRHHFETYKEEINLLHQHRTKKELL